ncbi:flavodoxin [Rhodococcus ruber]|uniref:flavodoxin n=1 Tax=Rhodococcus ruber TaxID=1830 RepID=UPI0009326638|nr:flavodoxin [Rhodococcus ruber]AWG97169.1 hypothetical protein DCN13_00480 [Rhodococcus ruber]
MAKNLSRRALLRAGALGGAGLIAAACTTGQPQQARPSTGVSPDMALDPDAKVLLAHFSRAGENYWNGGRRSLRIGNTQVLAEMIASRITCDSYRIEAADPYPASYDDTVERNVAEEHADARPAIANPLPQISDYDIVLLGSPVWNVRAPMIMSTFVHALDLTGKTILPFVTYAVSGIGTVEDDYRNMLPHTSIRTGLAVRGETAADAGPDIDRWLRTSRLIR